MHGEAQGDHPVRVLREGVRESNEAIDPRQTVSAAYHALLLATKMRRSAFCSSVKGPAVAPPSLPKPAACGSVR
ncbi:hypothetical protein C5C69_08640 [Rathayibacter sp. AY1C7]|nr:hypothetical protein C5C69_08640 [Rathayibacter sp. AY1C7]PPH55178.1 hypothetical protein C5C67_05350 [Rathayibacter sp. AY1E1]